MTQINALIAKMQGRELRFRKRVAELMLRAAQVRDLPILEQDLMVISRQYDLAIAAAILPCRSRPVAEGEDFAFLFLDLEEMDELFPGFFTVRIFRDENGQIMPEAHLLDEKGIFVRNCQFIMDDLYADLLGAKIPCSSRNTLIDSWIRRGEAYGIEGVLGDGTPFIITMEF